MDPDHHRQPRRRVRRSGSTRSGRGSPRPGALRGRQHGRVLRTHRPELDRIAGLGPRRRGDRRAEPALAHGWLCEPHPAGDDQVVLDGHTERSRPVLDQLVTSLVMLTPQIGRVPTLSPPASLRQPRLSHSTGISPRPPPGPPRAATRRPSQARPAPMPRPACPPGRRVRRRSSSPRPAAPV